jgi:hypothetical protein
MLKHGRLPDEAQDLEQERERGREQEPEPGQQPSTAMITQTAGPVLPLHFNRQQRLLMMWKE